MKYSIILILLLACSALGQIEATTKDGKAVVLKNDGTWSYAAKSAAGASDLLVEAAIIYRSGDVKPAARATFYLLDESLETILKTPELYELYKKDSNAPFAGYSSVGSTVAPFEKVEYSSMYSAFRGGQPTAPNFYPKALEAIKAHIKSTTQTDFNGKAKFENVASGSYFLFGDSPTQKSFVMWNVPIEIKAGTQTVILDQNNAAYAY